VLPPAVDDAWLAPRPPRPPRQGPLRVLVAARLDHDRNHGLLPAIARLAGPAAWHVAGDGPMRAELAARLPEVTFHGHLAPDALRALMLESDALLHTSQTDTFAEAVVEAMACALPVVVSNAGGPLCYVAHGHTGLVCSATPEAFAEALRALREDPDLRAYLSQNARTLAERLSWTELWRAVLAAIDR
jgi:glycosyltransferase involved in cell wall biosynthesis